MQPYQTHLHLYWVSKSQMSSQIPLNLRYKRMQLLGQQFDGSLNITNAADFSPRLLVSTIYLVRELLIKRSFAIAVLSQLAYTYL